MRPPDVATKRQTTIQTRWSDAELEMLDAKRGSLSRSLALRKALLDWPGMVEQPNGRAALLPKPPMAEPDIPMADGKTPGLVEVRTPGSSPPPIAPQNGKPHRHRAVTENIVRYDKGRAVRDFVCECGHRWER